MPEKHWAMCNHCNQGYETHTDSEGLCVSCFVAGHRGRICDQYCRTEPERADPKLAEALRMLYIERDTGESK